MNPKLKMQPQQNVERGQSSEVPALPEGRNDEIDRVRAVLTQSLCQVFLMGVYGLLWVFQKGCEVYAHTFLDTKSPVDPYSVIGIHVFLLHEPTLLVTPYGKDGQAETVESLGNSVQEVPVGGVSEEKDPFQPAFHDETEHCDYLY